MGFDCTLHVVNEQLIARRFVSRLLERSQEPSSFDKRPDAQELWKVVRAALSGRRLDDRKEAPSAEETANLICQLATVYCAAELPYHSERGFCLSLWPRGEVPRKYVGDPESLFGDLLVEHPELKGRFSKDLSGNGSTGIFVPAESVRGLLAWVERQMRGYPVADRRAFRGLILVLKQAAQRKLGYWEGADLPLPMQTIRPPAEQRRPDLEEAAAPEGSQMYPVGQGASTLVFELGAMRTAFVDLNTWPPRYRIIQGEYPRCAARSRSGRWVTAASTTSPPYYSAFVRDNPEADKTILPAPAERECGLSWVDFLGDRVLAVMGKQSVPGPEGFHLGWEHDLPALPLLEKDGGLVPIEGLPAGSERYPTWGTARLNDGSDVFLWLGNGYELREGRFELTFPLGAKPNHMEVSTAPFGRDGFFYMSDRRLYSIQRGRKPVSHMLKLSNVMYVSPAGDDAFLLKEGTNEMEDLGKLYFPDQDAYIRLKPELFEDEDPGLIRSLHWAAACGRLVASTAERFWSIPIETVLGLPRHRASTVIKVRF